MERAGFPQSTFVVLLFGEQAAREIAHGIPHGNKARGDDSDKDDDYIHDMHAHRIGVDDERTAAVAEADEAECLLQPAEQ